MSRLQTNKSEFQCIFHIDKGCARSVSTYVAGFLVNISQIDLSVYWRLKKTIRASWSHGFKAPECPRMPTLNGYRLA